MTTIHDKPTRDRPREKLQARGPAALSDFELLQALIGSGNKQADVTKIARNTLTLFKQYGANVSYEQLQQVTGLGPARITEILSALELSKRYLIDSEQPIIDSPEKAVEQLADIRGKKQEHFVVMTLDGANRLIAKRTITIGTLTSSLVAHNHPSGNLDISQTDRDVTDKLVDASVILGIELIDHVIVTKTASISII